MTWLSLMVVVGLSVLLVLMVVRDRARANRVQAGVPAEQPDRRPR